MRWGPGVIASSCYSPFEPQTNIFPAVRQRMLPELHTFYLLDGGFFMEASGQCYELKVWAPPKFSWSHNSQGDDEAFGRWLGLDEVTRVDLTRTPTGSSMLTCSHSTHARTHALRKGQVRTKLKDDCLQARYPALARNQICWHLHLDIQPPEMWEIHVFCFSQPVCGILV